MKTRKLFFLTAGIFLLALVSNVAKAQDPFKDLTDNGDIGTVQTPSINNFVTAYLSDPQDEHMEFLSGMWRRHLKNEPSEAGEKVTVDAKNGYVSFETSVDEDGYSSITEMCYWNCDDGLHKLFAENESVTQNGKPVFTEFTGLYIFVYDNATHKLYFVDQELLGLGEQVQGLVSFKLPRTGKDIEVFFDDGTQKKLAWNGKGFTLRDK